MRRNGTLILCYHRVAEGVEGTPSISASAPATSRPTSRSCRGHGNRRRSPMCLFRRGTKPRVVVTFDDGYRDNLTNALPIAGVQGRHRSPSS